MTMIANFDLGAPEPTEWTREEEEAARLDYQAAEEEAHRQHLQELEQQRWERILAARARMDEDFPLH